VYRRTLRECHLGAFRIPKGWLVRVCLREAHGRADVFPDPAAFDPGRFAARRYGKHEYAPFSDGPHACFGAALTVTVAKTFLHELAAGFDARLVSDGPVERDNRHWEHWRPSASLRVVLTAR
jgi:cytochrome P450